MPPAVAIVVLNWNGLADTLRCIASLERQTYPNFHILVVDNGSTDGSVAALRARPVG
jgi:GT2 family glycosyltransferase